MTRRNIARIVRVSTAIGLVLTAVLLAACSTQAAAPATGGGTESVPASAQPATPPTIKVLSPTDGDEVPAGDVTVKVEAANLKFTMPSNKNVAGEGHLHVTLDDRPFIMSVEPSVKIENVSPGTHKLVAELVQNNTDSLDPPVKQEITFVAK